MLHLTLDAAEKWLQPSVSGWTAPNALVIAPPRGDNRRARGPFAKSKVNTMIICQERPDRVACLKVDRRTQLSALEASLLCISFTVENGEGGPQGEKIKGHHETRHILQLPTQSRDRLTYSPVRRPPHQRPASEGTALRRASQHSPG